MQFAHPPSTRNNASLAFGTGLKTKGKGLKGLNIELSGEEDNLDQYMPPSRTQFEKRYGDTILGDYAEDGDDSDNS